MKTTLEKILFLTALALGIALRFAALGSAPLDDAEARLALVALDLSRGAVTVLPGQPGLILLTKALIALFSASNFVARLIPALAGSGLILAAWLLRDRLGRGAALLLAFFITVDPGLVAVSRQVSSHTLAIACLVLAAAFVWRREGVWGGVFTGLSLLSGPTVWPALLALVAAVWVYRGWDADASALRGWLDWKKFFGVAGASFILVGTLLLSEPRGISAAASSLVEYVRGWGQVATLPIPRLMAALFAYELPALVFGVIGLVQSIRTKDRLGQAFGIAWAALFVLFAAYPSRSALDLAWIGLPLLVLSARQFALQPALETEERVPVWGQAGLTAGLILYIAYSLLKIPPQSSPDAGLAAEYAVRLIVALVMLLAVTGMIAWGWTVSTALKGLRWGVTAVLGIFWVAAAFHAGGMSRLPETELLRGSARVQDADLMQLTIAQTNQWRPDPHRPLSVAVLNFDHPSMRWLLRGFDDVVYTGSLAANSFPEVVVTPNTEGVELASAYRGQELGWAKAPAWSLIAPSEWLRWLFLRDVPAESIETQRVILWVRADAFPGGLEGSLSPDEAPAEEAPAQSENLQ